jgi:hypothetical protein
MKPYRHDVCRQFMTSPQAAEFERQRNRAATKRSRMRKAGLLPPLPTCPRCGARCTNDRWLPLCSLCARSVGVDHADRYQSRSGKHQPRAVRLAAEEILLQLRAEARAAAGSVTDCDRQAA